jgi:hypothetical protein
LRDERKRDGEKKISIYYIFFKVRIEMKYKNKSKKKTHRKIKKTQRKTRNLRRRTIRRITLRKKGGFWPFTQDPKPDLNPPNPNNVVLLPPDNAVEMNPNPLLEKNENMKPYKTCPVCNENGLLDQEFGSTINSVWKTCIEINGRKNKIIYVTSKNVFIKSIESLQIPEFYIKIQETKEETITCKLMIEDKYISCFLYICGEWYVIMRLFGKTINTDFLARTEANKAFYKLKNVNIDLDVDTLITSDETPDSVNGSGLVLISPDTYTKISPYTWLSDNKTRTIKLNDDCFENINKQSMVNGEPVFNILQRFRQQKILGNIVKYGIIDSFFDFF